MQIRKGNKKMLVKFYWKDDNSSEWAKAPSKPEVINEEKYVREYNCNTVAEAWKLWANDSLQKVSRLKYEAYAIKY